jgi:hypothetical protein
MQKKLFISLFLLSTFSINLFSTVHIPRSAAQAAEEWIEPINLSQSGAATIPVIVIDSNGLVHITWQDEIDGTGYTVYKSEEWVEPAIIQAPFEGYIPRLVADSRGNIHALWIDVDQNLYYSRISGAQMSQPEWTSSVRVAGSVLDFDVVVDSGDRLQLVYVNAENTESKPSGVYYQQSAVAGGEWQTSTVLYSSPYFRAIEPEEAQVGITQATVGDIQRLLVVWDNRPRNKIFLIKSDDAGKTWGSPTDVDGPAISGRTSRPFNIQISSAGGKVLMVWQSSRQTDTCVQFSQWSIDGGESWGPRIRLSADIPGCPDIDEMLPVGEDLFLLFASIPVQSYILAWNGSQWSKSYLQPKLSDFYDPETADQVDLSCRQAVLFEGSQLFVAGCDSNGGGDIWFTRRSAGTIDDWFPLPLTWSTPSIVYSSQSIIPAVKIISDEDTYVHALWNQLAHPSDVGIKSIFYARWNEGIWTQPIQITSNSSGLLDSIPVVIDSRKRILTAWNDYKAGNPKFRWVSAERAIQASDWSLPTHLTESELIVNSADISLAEDRTIYLTYSIPLNEKRGIHLTTSQDGGQTWSEPVVLFDGVSFGWDMVNNPRIRHSSQNDVNLLWTTHPVPGFDGPISLYYARSQDGGVNWSTPVQISEGMIEDGQYVHLGEGKLGRLWQESQSNRSTMVLEISTDHGQSWNRTTVALENNGPIGIAVNQTGRLHLLQVNEDISEELTIYEWVWDGDKWSSGESARLPRTGRLTVSSLAATIRVDNLMVVLISAREKDELNSEDEESLLLLTYRQLDSSGPLITSDTQPDMVTEVVPTEDVVEPTMTPTNQPTLTPTQTKTTEPSPSSTDTSDEVAQLTIDTTDQTIENSADGRIIMGAAGIILLVFSMAFYTAIRARKN